MHWRRKWQPTPVFLPGESQGWGSLVGCCLWGRTELDTTEVTWQQQQHIPRETDGETVETVLDFILGGSKITADDDCSHEIKRLLLLGRKVMTNLEQMIPYTHLFIYSFTYLLFIHTFICSASIH